MRPLPKFSYNVTRDYPYKWFTPVAIIGGIVLTALFSAINFFSTAYNMVSITTDNPQDYGAEIYKMWLYTRLLTIKFRPTCDNAVLSAESSLRTNHSRFDYQLVDISNGDPTLSYDNQALAQCYASRVMLDFSTWYDRSAAQINVSSWGLHVTVDLQCQLDPNQYEIEEFILRTHYDPFIDSRTSQTTLTWNLALSPASKWAEVLMLAFWKETITAMSSQTQTSLGSDDTMTRHNLTHGYVQLDNYSSKHRSKAMTDDDYFDSMSCVFIDATKSVKYTASASTSGYSGTLNESYVHSTAWPNIWTPVDHLAKAVLSAAYVDLGQASAANNSMVSNADSLRYWTANLSRIVDRSSVNIGIRIGDHHVNITDYDTDAALPMDDEYKMGTPDWDQTSRAAFLTTYTCHVPQLKPPFNIFVSILVADLVFLRTVWSLYNFMVAYFLKSRHPNANICDECLARKKEDDVEVVEEKEDPVHYNKSHGVDEHTIELDYLGPPSPPTRRDDQGSAQSLLIHRHV
ncbi:hypothetical protein KCU99_g8182, partial [Aureobasidium melanogenum]